MKIIGAIKKLIDIKKKDNDSNNEVANTVKMNILEQPSKDLGQYISDCFYVVFGKIELISQKKKIKYYYELDEYRKELERELSNIPEDKIIEPSTQVVCNALENSRYCVEEEELRQMFSKLIANSFNLDKVNDVHPSYGEIIRQMAPLDARLFKWIYSNKYIPIIKIKIKDKGGSSFKYYKNYYLSENFGNYDTLHLSIDNLERLGLISISFETYYTDTRLYDHIKMQPFFVEVVKEANNIINHQKQEIEFHYGILEKTAYGISFYLSCN